MLAKQSWKSGGGPTRFNNCWTCTVTQAFLPYLSKSGKTCKDPQVCGHRKMPTGKKTDTGEGAYFGCLSVWSREVDSAGAQWMNVVKGH